MKQFLSELLLIAVVGLLVVGPDELPVLMRKGKNILNQVKHASRDFTKTIMGEEEVTDLKKEVAKLNQDMRTIIDLEGKEQETFDISDIMKEKK
jgi:sec-independent protein translocase protein TatB